MKGQDYPKEQMLPLLPSVRQLLCDTMRFGPHTQQSEKSTLKWGTDFHLINKLNSYVFIAQLQNETVKEQRYKN